MSEGGGKLGCVMGERRGGERGHGGKVGCMPSRMGFRTVGRQTLQSKFVVGLCCRKRVANATLLFQYEELPAGLWYLPSEFEPGVQLPTVLEEVFQASQFPKKLSHNSRTIHLLQTELLWNRQRYFA